jgi:hypothetical protein
MKLYYLKLGSNKMRDFILFSMTYNISIYFTWSEETFFGEKLFYATITDQPDNKITTEEKARLLTENYSSNIVKIEDLK